MRRFEPVFQQVKRSPNPLDVIRTLTDDEVVGALAVSSLHQDPYLANVLSTEASNRMGRANASIANLGEGVIAVDTEGRVTFLNAAAEQALGWSRADIVGRPMHDTVHARRPDGTDFPAEACPLLGVLRTGELVRRDDAFLRKDGTFVPVACTSAPVTRRGEIVGCVHVFRDVTEERRAEAALRDSEGRLRTMIERSPFSMQVFAPDGRARFANRAWETLWEASRSDLEGYDVLRDPQLQALGVLPLVRRAFAGESVRLPVVRYDPAASGLRGRPRWVAAHAYAVRDGSGQVTEVVLAYEDVTDRKRSEDRMRLLAEATADLASSLDYERTLASVARLAVPAFADWCFVDLATDDGGFRRLSVAHADPGKADLAARFRRYYPPRPDAPRGIAKVLRTRRVELIEDLGDDVLVAVARDAGHLAALREIGIRSAVVAPLVADGQLLGTISFVTAESHRRYDEEDAALADEIARRAALAVANARHYAEARAAERQVRARVAQQAAVAELGQLALGGTPFGPLADRAAEVLREGLSCDLSSVLERASPAGDLRFVASRGWGDEASRPIPSEEVADAAYALARGEPVVVDDFGTEARFKAPPALAAAGVRSGISAVIEGERDGRAYGVLCAHTRNQRDFGADDVHFVQAVANALASAVRRDRADEALRARTETHERVVEALSELGHGVVLVSGTRILFANAAVERLSGYTLDELRALPDAFALVPAADRERVRTDVQAVVEAGGKTRIDVSLVRKDGARRELEVALTTVRSEDGAELIAFVDDVTHRARSEEALRASEERYRLLVESSPEAIAVHRGGVLVYLNPAGARLLGARDPDSLTGKPVLDFVHPDPRDLVLKRMREGIENRRPLPPAAEKLVRLDGEALHVEVASMPITYDGAPATQLVLRDITGYVRARAEVEALNAALERRVRERTQALEAANAELESFSYSVSHDLRAPLRGIDYFSRVLEEESRERLRPEEREYLSRLRAESGRATQLVGDLLSLAQVARVEIRRERVDVSALAREVVRDLRADDPERRVETRIEEGLVADADPRLLRIVLENLLGNAWKYTAKRPDARVEVLGGSPGPDGRPAFVVKDNGAGFDPAEAHRLFGAFQRLHAPSEFQGTGVGLATVQRIVLRHGGRVHAEGAPGRGAAFTFSL